MKSVEFNVDYLKQLTDYLTTDDRAKVNELINLYKDRKIRNYKTIEKIIITYVIDKKIKKNK